MKHQFEICIPEREIKRTYLGISQSPRFTLPPIIRLLCILKGSMGAYGTYLAKLNTKNLRRSGHTRSKPKPPGWDGDSYNILATSLEE